MGHSTYTHTYIYNHTYIYSYYIYSYYTYSYYIYMYIYIELIISCRFTVEIDILWFWASKMGRWNRNKNGHLVPGTGPTMTPVRLWPRCGVVSSIENTTLSWTKNKPMWPVTNVNICYCTNIHTNIQVWTILGQFRGQLAGQIHLEGLPWGFWNRREGHLWPKSNCMAGWQCE